MSVWLKTAVLYLVLLLPAYAPFFFAGKSLYQGDISLYFEPTLRYMSDAVRGGRLPLWNPLVSGGVPQIGIISPGLFYLPNAVFLFMPFGSALAAVMLLHQWLAGFGSFLFLKQTGRSDPAAIIGGAALMLCGYMFGSSQCFTLPATFAWTPLALFFATMLMQSGRWRWCACLGLVYGMQILAGRPELFLSSGGIYVAYSLLGRDGESGGGRLRCSVVGMLGLILGTGVACVALLPVLELFSLSPRTAGLPLSEVTRWSAGWLDWLQVILTRPFGDLVVSNYELNPQYPGLFPYISSLFLGAPAITLALFGCFDRTWKQRWLWLCLGLLFALLALGEFGPLLPALHRVLAGIAIFRYPIKLAVFSLMALSFACAAGWDSVVSGRASGLSVKVALSIWLVATIAGNVLFLDLSGLSGSLAQQILGPRADTLRAGMTAALTGTGAQLCFVSILGLGVCVLSMQLRHESLRTPARLILLGLLTVAPILINGPFCLWHMTDQSFYNQPSSLASWLDERRKSLGENFRILTFLPDVILSPRPYWREKDPQSHSILLSTYERQILEPDTNMDFGISSSYGFVPTDTRAFKMLYAGVSVRSAQHRDAGNTGGSSDAPLFRFCQLTNTRYLVTLNNRPNRARHTLEPMPLLDPKYFRLDHEESNLNIRIYEIPAPLPRAYFRDHWQPVASQVDALKQIFWAERSGFDPASSVLICRELGAVDVPEPPKRTARGPQPEKGGPAVAIVSDDGERVEVTVDNSAPGFLVLADTHYPGWKAYENGVPLELYQANGFQKAAWLEQGRHRISFNFKPYSLFWGVVLSLTSLAILLTLLLADMARRLDPFEPNGDAPCRQP